MTDVTYTHDTPPPATGPLGEYPASTLSFKLDLEGLQLTWTLRGSDESMAKRLPRVLDYIRRLQAKLPKPAATPAPATASPAPPLEERADWCPIHQVAMTQQANERGSWYSHRVPGEGYCKGRRAKAGA